MESVYRMHFVAKLQGLGYRKRIKKELRDVDQRLQLPVEILKQILSYLPREDRRTLFSLYSASRTFRAIVSPVLYCCLNFIIDLPVLQKRIRLPKVLSSPNLIFYIVELNLTLFDGEINRSSGRRRIEVPSRRQSRRLEAIAGKTAMVLLNLERLKVDCGMFGGYAKTVRFFERLSTRRLKVLYIRCLCMGFDFNPEKILSAPCLQTVTSLGWSVPCLPGDILDNRFWENVAYLPNLDRIGLDHPSACSITGIIHSRPVRRMDIRYYDPYIQQLIRLHAGHLTHLNIVGCDRLGDDLRPLLQDIAPDLKHLEFLGMLNMDYTTQEQLFKRLAALKCLRTTLKFLHMSIDREPSWLLGTVPRIETLFPKLRVILLFEQGGFIRQDVTEDWIIWKEAIFDLLQWQVLEDSIESLLGDFPLAKGGVVLS